MSIRQTNPGWIKRIRAQYRNAGTHVLAVGFPASETGGIRYPDGERVIDVAVANNFGTEDHVPRRDFMTPGGARAVRDTVPITRAAIPKINQGLMTAEDALRIMGPKAQVALQKEIVALDTPPNSPVTIERKGSSNPLIATGLMVQSVSHAVRRQSGS